MGRMDVLGQTKRTILRIRSLSFTLVKPLNWFLRIVIMLRIILLRILTYLFSMKTKSSNTLHYYYVCTSSIDKE